MSMVRTVCALSVALLLAVYGRSVLAEGSATKQSPPDKFRQLDELLPTPNSYRTASGAPGKDYWQQQADYEISVELDDEHQRIEGSEKITYTNNSPDALPYLWVQLDPSLFAADADSLLTATAPTLDGATFDEVRAILKREKFDGGIHVRSVKDASGSELPHTIVKTMMRVDLPEPLASGASVSFSIDWDYNLVDAELIFARSGYEFFEKDGNYIYEIAQWYPRMCAYTDYGGWQNKQFLGEGEFTLEFGDYLVRITAPADHVVAATGTLLNDEEVLTARQRRRLAKARRASEPVMVITPDEAKKNEKSRSKNKKTWIFKADRVRDFAFASSRKFIWDAWQQDIEGKAVMAMSFYPKEGEPLWSKYSTQAVVHALRVYSKHTFPFPYPVMISVNGPVRGMEYPMITFNGARPDADDGTYSKRKKYGLISVIIHEVGHNFFPMVVNSDERQWTWLDEGLNSFLQQIAEQTWEDGYPSRRADQQRLVDYMKDPHQRPIMTNSESLLQFSNNAYLKPSAALNTLRETILGRELFDFAFKQYANRWKFKRPTPADFFRTMEDASGFDLDWFFRGWFYTTDHTDIAIENVRLLTIDTRNPDIEKPRKKTERDEEAKTIRQQRDKALDKRIDQVEGLTDFYNEFDELDVTEADRREFQKFVKRLDKEEKKVLADRSRFYVVDLVNRGGLVMPVILEIEYTDGSTDELRLAAEIWRFNSRRISKLIVTDKQIKRLTVDPHKETPDVDRTNNEFPPKIDERRFVITKEKKSRNPMQKARDETKRKEKERAQKKEDRKDQTGEIKPLESGKRRRR